MFTLCTTVWGLPYWMPPLRSAWWSLGLGLSLEPAAAQAKHWRSYQSSSRALDNLGFERWDTRGPQPLESSPLTPASESPIPRPRSPAVTFRKWPLPLMVVMCVCICAYALVCVHCASTQGHWCALGIRFWKPDLDSEGRNTNWISVAAKSLPGPRATQLGHLGFWRDLATMGSSA